MDLKFLISYGDDSVHGSQLLTTDMHDADFFSGYTADEILKKFPSNFAIVDMPFDKEHKYYAASFKNIDEMAEFLATTGGTVVVNDFDSDHTEKYKYCIELFSY